MDAQLRNELKELARLERLRASVRKLEAMRDKDMGWERRRVKKPDPAAIKKLSEDIAALPKRTRTWQRLTKSELEPVLRTVRHLIARQKRRLLPVTLLDFQQDGTASASLRDKSA